MAVDVVEIPQTQARHVWWCGDDSDLFAGNFAEFIAPFRPGAISINHTYAPPQQLHLFRTTEEGREFNPYVNGYKVEIDPEALRRTFVIDEESIIDIGFFVRGVPYKILGLFETDRHLIGPKEYNNRPTHIDIPMYLLVPISKAAMYLVA